MRVLVQRVKKANVIVNGKIVGNIEKGLVLLVGITHNDDEKKCRFFSTKGLQLKNFP